MIRELPDTVTMTAFPFRKAHFIGLAGVGMSATAIPLAAPFPSHLGRARASASKNRPPAANVTHGPHNIYYMYLYFWSALLYPLDRLSGGVQKLLRSFRRSHLSMGRRFGAMYAAPVSLIEPKSIYNAAFPACVGRPSRQIGEWRLGSRSTEVCV